MSKPFPVGPAILMLATGLALGPGAAEAAPDAKLLAAATQAQPEMVEMLKSMVMIESGSGCRGTWTPSTVRAC